MADLWWLRARCRGMDPEFFYQQAQKPAQAVCRECPVSRQCLSEAMEAERRLTYYNHGDSEAGAWHNLTLRNGVFGGLTAFQRWALEFPDLAVIHKQREQARYEREAANQKARADAKRKARLAASPEQRAKERARKASLNKRRRLDPDYAGRERERLQARRKASSVGAAAS